MVLDRKRLAVLLREIEGGVIEKLHEEIHALQRELDDLSTEEAHCSMIAEVALRSRSMEESICGIGAKGVPDLDFAIQNYCKEQKRILKECIVKCMNKQLVVHAVYKAFIGLEEKEKKILGVALKNSLASASYKLEKEGILISKTTLMRVKNDLLDQILVEVNREIDMLPEDLC